MILQEALQYDISNERGDPVRKQYYMNIDGFKERGREVIKLSIWKIHIFFSCRKASFPPLFYRKMFSLTIFAFSINIHTRK